MLTLTHPEAPAAVTVSITENLGEVETVINLSHRKTGEALEVTVISDSPLSPQETRAAIDTATQGRRWDYKFLAIAAFAHEF